MKKLKIILGTSLLAIAGYFTIAADHIDAPAVAGGTSDITDFYAFEGENGSSIAFVANVQGLIAPGNTGAAAFDENVMIEFNIDNDGDMVEDLVIQAIPRNGRMYFFGPIAPNATGTASTAMTNAAQTDVQITPYGDAPKVGVNTQTGTKAFAGPRDDPFFFDFVQYGEIIAGNMPGGFDSATAADTFAGSNVMSVVVEVNKGLIGASGTINTWVETKRKQ